MSNFSDDALDAIADDPWTTWAANAPRELAAELRAYRRQHGPLMPGQYVAELTPRVIDNPADLDATADNAVVIDSDGSPWQHRRGDWFVATDGGVECFGSDELLDKYGPVTLVWTPGVA